MKMARALVEVGTSSVEELRPKYPNETRIQEPTLTSVMVERLNSLPNFKALPERYYTDIFVDDCRLERSIDLTPTFGGCRSDIFIIHSSRGDAESTDLARQLALIEVKIVDEGRKLTGLRDDYAKIEKFRNYLSKHRSVTEVDGYVAALVCDLDTGVTAEQAIESISTALPPGICIDQGDRVEAMGGGWGWRFVCIKAPPLHPSSR